MCFKEKIFRQERTQVISEEKNRSQVRERCIGFQLLGINSEIVHSASSTCKASSYISDRHCVLCKSNSSFFLYFPSEGDLGFNLGAAGIF